MNQQFPVITRPSTSRTGKLQRINQTNAMFAAPRSKKAKRSMTEAGFDTVMAISLGAGAVLFFFAKIVPGLPHVLALHGVI